jgi:hypothetical protein
LLFVDGPATIAFVFLLVYLVITSFGNHTVEKHVMAGAVVMQMLIADTLFLLVASNVHHVLLAKLCREVNQE